jgi:hypothetical protein
LVRINEALGYKSKCTEELGRACQTNSAGNPRLFHMVFIASHSDWIKEGWATPFNTDVFLVLERSKNDHVFWHNATLLVTSQQRRARRAS